MAVNKTSRAGRASALALAVAALALPGMASAGPDDNGRGWGRGGERGERAQNNNNGNQSQSQAQAQPRAWGGRSDAARNDGGDRPQWGARNDQSRGNGAQAQAWGRGNGQTDAGQTRAWPTRQGGNWQQQAPAANPAPAPAQQAPRWASPSTWGSRDGRQDDRRDGDRRGSWGDNTNHSGTWTNRDGSWTRDGRRDGDRYRNDTNNRYAEQWRNQQNRSGSWTNNHYRDGNRTDYRNWDRRWRDNNRYDWYRYRSYNPTVFRWGTYYAPYRNYSYRRLSIGFYLDQMFYGSRYWINDPYQYRLPEVYGPYRWVRYYDDALLVNVYDGEVVDVIYDFFW